MEMNIDEEQLTLKRKFGGKKKRVGVHSLEKESTKLLLTSQVVVRLEARSRVGRKGGEWCTRENTMGATS